jgi:hypothetical protein
VSYAYDDEQLVALKDLGVSFADGPPKHVGALFNPFGAAMWLNTAGMAMVLVSKKYVLVGPVVLRALRTRGMFNEEARAEFYEVSGEVPGTGEFIKESLGLLFKGREFEGIDRPVTLRPTIRGEDFNLTRQM